MGKYTGFNVFLRHAIKYGFSLFGLPKTGQTISYAAGDDGSYKKGYPQKGTHYTDNGDGTITDNATGLMWVKDGAGAGANNGSDLTWANAITFAEGLTFAGYSDWRLPNAKELISLIDLSVWDPAINAIFKNIKADYYWTSSTAKSVTTWGWTVGFTEGDLFFDLKTNSNPVLPVRGGV